MKKAVSRRALLQVGGLVLAGWGTDGHGAAGTPDAATSPVSFARDIAGGRFAGKVVLITGATSGIGEETAYAFAREGANVFFCGRREGLGKGVEARIRGFGGEGTYMRADVRREADVKAFVEGCIQTYGRLDIAFNNAGIGAPALAPIPDQPLADFEDVMRTNAFGVFLCLKYELPLLLRNAPAGAFGTRGVVINTASTSGLTGFAHISPYSASKHAIIGLTKCAALEYSPFGIRVSSISPGGVDTPMRHRAYQGRVPPGGPDPPAPNLYRRTNTVAEMAQVVMFLASEAGSCITGTDIDVTGGYHAGAHLTMAPATAGK